jgi:hypothetical protein
MSYIRSDEEWYMNQGMSPEQAKKRCRIDQMMEGKDPGVCNPIKAKQYAEDLKDAMLKAQEEE